MPIINTVLGGKKPTGTYTATGATSNYDAYANGKRYITIGQGSASNSTDTTARDSTGTSLSSNVLTVQATVTPTVSAGWVDSGVAGTIKIKGTVPTQTKSAAGAGTVNPDSGKLLSSVNVSAGSAVVTPKAVSANTLTGVWSSTNDRYEVSQEGQTISVSGSCTPGWVDSVSSGNVTVNAPNKHIIDRAGITQTSAASYTSSGTLTSGQYINIAPGYNPVGTTYQAPTITQIQGDAAPENVLASKTFMSASTTTIQTGIMVNNGSWSYDLTQNNSPVMIPEGYHDGFGTVVSRIPAGTVTINTSGGTSLGIISAGQQIKIGAGCYNYDQYYTAEDLATPGEIIPYSNDGAVTWGTYVRDDSQDTSTFAPYAWAWKSGTQVEDDSGNYHSVIYTDSQTPSTDDYVYDQGGGLINYTSVTYVAVKSYSEGGGTQTYVPAWSEWTTTGTAMSILKELDFKISSPNAWSAHNGEYFGIGYYMYTDPTTYTNVYYRNFADIHENGGQATVLSLYKTSEEVSTMSHSQAVHLKLLLQDPTATIDSGSFFVYEANTNNLIGSCTIDIPNIDSPGSSKDYTGDVVIEVEFALTSSNQLEYRYRITGLYYGTSN